LQVHGVLISPLAENKFKTDNINLFYTSNYGKGINALDLSNNKIKHFGVSNGILQNDTIIGITQNNNGTIYLMTSGGLHISKDGLKSFEFISHHIPNEIKKNYFKDIIQMPDNSFAIIAENKIFIINPFTKKNIEIKIPGTAPLVARFEKLMGIDNNGKLYFENNGSIFRLEKDYVVKHLWTNDINPKLRVTACFIDKTDVLWVSVDAQGLIKKNLQLAPFNSYNYSNGFFLDMYEKLGIPRNKLPLKWYDDKATAYLYYNYYSNDSLLYIIHSTQKSEKDNAFIWHNGDLHSLPQVSIKNYSLLRGIATSNDGELWTADIQNSGLWKWKNKETEPVFYPFDTTSNNSIIGTEIGDVELINKQLWISTYGKGLFLFEDEKMNEEFSKNYSASNLPNNLTEIIQDPNDSNLLWIGSRGEGLLLLNKKNGLVKIFTTDNGLPNNTVYCIVLDKFGFLWLSTNNGICRFNPKDFSSTSYVKADGLAGDEFNRNHKMVFTDGRIAFGGLDGYSIFNPKDFNEKQKSSFESLQITRIFINNVEQDFTGKLNLFNSSNEHLSLKLPYNKNNLSIEFASLQFNEPQKIRYRYMLNGVDETWIESGFNNVANFAQMQPGNYNLLINAKSSNGDWSSSVLELNIKISPPFWKTWWAYFIYFLIFIYFLRSYIQFNKSKIKKQHEAILIQKEADRLKEMAQMKDRFFSNVTHEFRTPLTLILSQLEKLQSDNSLST
ncbi:MAG: triple tyrosine motif-containing protein, partial [Ferruginibacter sp.]